MPCSLFRFWLAFSGGCGLILASVSLATEPLTYAAGKNAVGRHLVLIASDHEYRAEETMPALARILARHHGFDCTVLFGLNDAGEIEAGASHVPGLAALAAADGLVIFARFLALPPEQMQHLDQYLDRAGPVVGLRTSTHAFRYPDERKDDPYYAYHYRYEGEDYPGGFGHQVLGQSWVGHYGKNHVQSTRIAVVPAQSAHPILRGVGEMHVQAGGYNAEPAEDWQILTMAQPLLSMERAGEPDPAKPPMASEWTRFYEGSDGRQGRVFTSLYGASQDLLDADYRRLLINGIYWSLGLEERIDPTSRVDLVGPYAPNDFGQRREAKGIRPQAYRGFASPIPAHHDTALPPGFSR